MLSMLSIIILRDGTTGYFVDGKKKKMRKKEMYEKMSHLIQCSYFLGQGEDSMEPFHLIIT